MLKGFVYLKQNYILKVNKKENTYH